MISINIVLANRISLFASVLDFKVQKGLHGDKVGSTYLGALNLKVLNFCIVFNKNGLD